MAYGKETMRKAGEMIRRMDDSYSAHSAGMYDKANPAVRTAAYMVGGAHPSFRKAEPDYRDGAGQMEQMLGTAMQYAVPAANAVPKYVLPAAGVTLAGKGLFDMGVMLGQAAAANQQTAGTITPS